MMQAITAVHDVGGYISSPAPLIKLQHIICCFLIYSFGDNIMQKTIGMSFFWLITCIVISHMHLRIYLFTYCTVLSFYVLS